MKCVYCHREYESITLDHVFPLSWYPATTPRDSEKWKVPSCTQCNHDFGILEDELKARLVLCFAKADENIKGIGDKATRGWRPQFGHSERDREMRQRRLDKLRKDVIPAEEIPEGAVLPGFGAIDNLLISDLYAIGVPQDDLSRFTQKLVRGFSYIFFGVLIPGDCEIHTYFERCEEFDDMMIKFGRHDARGPGIEIIYAKADGHRFAAAFKFEIWGRLRLYSFVLPKSRV